MGRNLYLSNYELEDAIEKYFKEIMPLNQKSVEIKTEDACGRITSKPVYSRISSPFYNSAAMDGIATLSSKTKGASDKDQIELLENKDYIEVDTGDYIPKEYDCVIMAEDLIKEEDKKAKIYKSAAIGQNIRPLGEDIVEKQLIIPSNTKITPMSMGAMLAGGVNTLYVYKSPKVAVIPTGTELVNPDSKLKKGDIIDFNSRVFSSQIKNWGGDFKRYNIVKDDYEKIKETVKLASENEDMVIINAGSSKGREDYTSKVIKELGKVIVHGVAIKPGKPVIMGVINKKPVIGVPGYPVAGYIIMNLIVKKIVKYFIGEKVKEAKKVDAILSKRIVSSLKYLEFVRVKLGYVGEKLIATPLKRGSGSVMSVVKADGIFEVLQSVEGVEKGEHIKVSLLKNEEDIKNTIVCIGSHDPILDVVEDMIHKKDYFLSSAHVGSMGGIMALKNEETHIAPIHLLDMETGEYNISYIKKYLKNKKISLIKCLDRVQGLIVPKGNLLGIKDIYDIYDKKLKYVNRQRGAGTRLLLDYKLKELKINPRDIKGYEREEFTHLAVAAVVANDDADCGLGVYSAAAMMGLDFVPIWNEEYDIALPTEYLKDEKIQEFIKIIKSEEFKKELDNMGGYGYSQIGKIINI